MVKGTIIFERRTLYKRPAKLISPKRYQSSSFLLMKLGWNSTLGKRKRRMSMDVKSLPVFPGPPRRLQRPIKIELVHVGKLSSEPIFADKPLAPSLDPPLWITRRTLANCEGNKHTSQWIKPILVESRTLMLKPPMVALIHQSIPSNTRSSIFPMYRSKSS